MKPTYIATNLEELFDNATEDVQKIISDGEVANTAAILGKVYKIPLGSYISLSNIISFILIGALKPEDVVRAIEELLDLSTEDAYKLAQDLEKSILEKARVSILGKSGEGVVNLTFKDPHSPDELRKEILDTTKRESGLVKDQSNTSKSVATKQKRVVLTPGSRSELLEQLQVLDTIPNDEEVDARLSHIQEQIASLNKKDERELDANVSLQNFMSVGKSNDPVNAELKSATYSKAPTKYNIDPYREVSEA